MRDSSYPVALSYHTRRLEATKRLVHVHIASGALDKAHALAGQLFSSACAAGMQAAAAEALLLLARAHLAADDPISALPYVLSCTLHAMELNLDMLAAEAAVVCSQAWLALSPGHLPQVLNDVERVLPLVLAHGSAALRSEVQMAVADMLLAGADVEEVRQRQHWAAALLAGAAAGWESLHDWRQARKAHFMLAHLYNAVGAQQMRYAAAQQCQRLDAMLASASDAAMPLTAA